MIIPIFAEWGWAQNPKRVCDFNELAKNSILSQEGVKMQIKPILGNITRAYQRIC